MDGWLSQHQLGFLSLLFSELSKVGFALDLVESYDLQNRPQNDL